MNTLFLLMARHDARAIIPLETLQRDYFPHLSLVKLMGKLQATEITSQAITSYAKSRVEGGASPATVANDLTLLGTVFDLARPAWGFALDRTALTDAKIVSKKLGYIGRAKQRDRRPTLDELDRIMTHFHDAARRRPWSTPMVKIVPFALFSTRRQDEICRIRWDGLDHDLKRAYITDVKHPRKKIGNHKWAVLTDEAWSILMSMPKISEWVFPYSADAIGAQCERSMDWLGIEDLRFHDLRHEGVSRLFEMDWSIPRVSTVSLHDDWESLKRYTHMVGHGDRYAGWKWLPIAVGFTPAKPRKQAQRKARSKDKFEKRRPNRAASLRVRASG